MEITIRNLQKKVPLDPVKIKKAILKTLRFEDIKKSARITVVFVNDKKIRELNLVYLKKNSPTDVLSFDYTTNAECSNSTKKKLHSGNEILSDIVISVDTAYRNARIFKTSPLYEVYLYIIHGLLHILGYDDRTARQRKIMEDKVNRILTALNIKH